MIERKSIFYVFIIYIILWEPLHGFIIHFDAGGRIIFVLGMFFFGYGLYITFNKFYFKEWLYFDLPLFLWIFWNSINSLVFNPVAQSDFTLYNYIYNIIFPFLIYLGIRLNLRNEDLTPYWKWYAIGSIFYIVIVVLFEGNNEEQRLGLHINSNEIAWMSLLGFIASFFYLRSKYLIYIIGILSACIIFLTASKKAFLSFLVFILIRYSLNPRISLVRRILFVLFFFLAVGIATDFVIENTTLGQRISTSIEINQYASDESELFDGRAYFYIIGWKLFLQNPISGIGITNFRYYSVYKMPAHSEWVIQLTETGIIGLGLFILFHFRLFSSALKVFRNKSHQEVGILLLSTLIVFYLMFAGRWVYSHLPYHIFLGLMITQIAQINQYERNQNLHYWQQYQLCI